MIDLFPILAHGMGPELHWFPQDVPLERLATTLVGMANASGGKVFLGISPRSGHVHGVSDPSVAIDRVFQAALLSDPPLVLPLPQVHPLGEVQVLEIIIPAGLPQVYRMEGR